MDPEPVRSALSRLTHSPLPSGVRGRNPGGERDGPVLSPTSTETLGRSLQLIFFTENGDSDLSRWFPSREAGGQ